MPKKGRVTGRHSPSKKLGRPPSFTPSARQKFLEERASGKPVTMAARKAGVSSTTVFRTAREDAEFKKQLEAANELACDHLEELMESMGRVGNIAALFGTLKAMRPEKWGSHVKIEHSGSIGTSADDLAAARARAAARDVAPTEEAVH